MSDRLATSDGEVLTRKIRVLSMDQLAEAVEQDDDWTGLTDAAERRRRQNRLNVRAYRRRKALKSKSDPRNAPVSEPSVKDEEPTTLCWVENQQRVSVFPVSKVKRYDNDLNTIMPKDTRPGVKPSGIMFPLSSDHLIVLLQYNVLRASITNRRLVSCLFPIPTTTCSSAALHVLPALPYPQTLPPSLAPTALQQSIPHEEWVDIIPHPVWRDNVLLALGSFDEDDLWADTMGGLFEGFPQCESERRGIIAWSPPWDVSGWEISEGFWRKWRWSFRGCEDVLVATNRWREMRGEKALVFDA